MSTRSFPWEQPGEQVTFATPEQVEVTYRVAPFATRCAAALLDHLLIFGLSSILVIGLIVFAANRPEPEIIAGAVVVGILLLFTLQTFYFVWAELRGGGQTWGKRRFSLRTVMASGHGLTFGASLLRNLARVVDNTPLLWIVPLISRTQQRLGDLLAGTIVVSESELDGPDGAAGIEIGHSYRELDEPRFLFAAGTEGRVFPDDLNLLEHVFARTAREPASSRSRALYRAVALKYVEHLSLADQAARAEADPRRFLEELYLYLRDRFEAPRF